MNLENFRRCIYFTVDILTFEKNGTFLFLSQCVGYWINFQDIYSFTYQKTFFRTLFFFVFKIVKSLQSIVQIFTPIIFKKLISFYYMTLFLIAWSLVAKTAFIIPFKYEHVIGNFQGFCRFSIAVFKSISRWLYLQHRIYFVFIEQAHEELFPRKRLFSRKWWCRKFLSYVSDYSIVFDSVYSLFVRYWSKIGQLLKSFFSNLRNEPGPFYLLFYHILWKEKLGYENERVICMRNVFFVCFDTNTKVTIRLFKLIILEASIHS